MSVPTRCGTAAFDDSSAALFTPAATPPPHGRSAAVLPTAAAPQQRGYERYDDGDGDDEFALVGGDAADDELALESPQRAPRGGSAEARRAATDELRAATDQLELLLRDA
jgi:hypothetical protein